MADSNIDDLDPALRSLALQWLSECYAQGLQVRIIQTWRDPLYQDRLYAQGRTSPGPIVTDLQGSQSLHCCTTPDGKPAAKAFDFACFAKDNSYISDGTDPAYAAAAQVGVSIGLIWGGNWTGFTDPDHLQLTD